MMREAVLNGVRRGAMWPWTTIADVTRPVGANLVSRQLIAAAPGRLKADEITGIPTGDA